MLLWLEKKNLNCFEEANFLYQNRWGERTIKRISGRDGVYGLVETVVLFGNVYWVELIKWMKSNGRKVVEEIKGPVKIDNRWTVYC